MEQSLPHILIAEREFLIALDAEYLIKSALDCRTTLVRPEQLDQWDSAALATVDLCLFDIPLDITPKTTARIERLIGANVPLVFTSLSDVPRRNVKGFEAIPLVLKPHDSGTLVPLVAAGLRQKPQTPAQADQN